MPTVEIRAARVIVEVTVPNRRRRHELRSIEAALMRDDPELERRLAGAASRQRAWLLAAALSAAILLASLVAGYGTGVFLGLVGTVAGIWQLRGPANPLDVSNLRGSADAPAQDR